MQSYDLMLNSTLINPTSIMNDPIHPSPGPPESNGDARLPEPENPTKVEGGNESNDVINSRNVKNSSKINGSSSGGGNEVVGRRERPTRACTARPPKYMYPPIIEKRARPLKKVKVEKVVVVEEEEEDMEEEKSGKLVASLVNEPTLDQMPRWRLRSMWELASILNFLHVFRPLLNIHVEFSAEELESALLNPNSTLDDIHIPLLKSIPPVIRMTCGRDSWVSVLCRKLRDWWQWVAEGDLPIVASHGAEIGTYKTLDPSIRVVILKALCDIRVEQEDIRSYIDNSVKHGIQLSVFRKERIGGDSHGISYWYEDDELIGHRLYREIRKVERKVEAKKAKPKGSHVLPSTSYEWETVATNLDEFVDVSETLFSSKNRTEVSLGKKLKNDFLPEIEKIHKRKEKLLKKQQRRALLLDNFVTMDGLVAGRSLRDRKPVTYTFDDFDRSINEAIKITKRKQPSPEPGVRRQIAKSEFSDNGRWNGDPHSSMHMSFSSASPSDYDEMDEDHKTGSMDLRPRQKSLRYSEKKISDPRSDNEEYTESDDDVVGEVVYDDEYLRKRKQKNKITSSSEGEGDEEYHWSEETGEDEIEEDDEEEEDSMNLSEDSDHSREKYRKPEGRTRRGPKLHGRTRRGTKLRSVGDSDPGLRRSKRTTRNRINYQQYEFSESETESAKRGRTEASEMHQFDATDYAEYSTESKDSDEGNEEEQEEMEYDQSTPNDYDQSAAMPVEKVEVQPSTNVESPTQDDPNGVGNRRFLDLNELAPGSGFEDGLSALAKDNDVKGE